MEQVDGTRLFELKVVGGKKADLHGLFFNINEDYLVNHLNISGVDVAGQEYGNASNFKNGNNVKGHGLRPYDVSVDLGTAGIGKDMVNSTFFVLESTTGVGLTLDLIVQVEFSSRKTSVGQKITAIAPAAPDAIDDVIVADEDTATSQGSPNSNLIANDTDMDGDILTIVAVNGDNTLAGRQFTLSTGGLLIVNNSGNFDFELNNQGFDTATVEITVNGVNDQPIAQDVDAAVGEDDDSVSGSFAGTDIDTTDQLSFEIIGLPVDEFGHQYGEVVNNGNGTFTFSPLDNFQFLDTGKSRDVSFQYVAIDDSGTANTTSVAKTIQ